VVENHPSKYAVQAKGLVKRFGDFTAVNGIDFEVQRGEIFGLLGPNGSGKTTTIRMTLGLLKPTEGNVEVLGITVAKQPQKIRPHIGYMSQRFSLYNDLTVMQNLRFYGKVYGLRNKLLNERIQGAIEMAGLKGHENTRTRDLAGGWRQRRAFWDLLYNLVAEGITVFVTTHYMDEAEHGHRLAFIQRGELIAYGTPGEIKSEMMRGQVLEITPSNTVGAVEILRAAWQSGDLPLDEVALHGSLVHVVADNMDELIQPIAERLNQAEIEIHHQEIIEPSLEDVFIACMRE
jgi:ABC-2 type transport system ATP-binding protein